MKNRNMPSGNAMPMKDTLERILIRHFFLKLLQVELVTIFSVIIILLAWGAYYNHQINRVLSQRLTQTVGYYDEFLTTIGKMEQVIVAKDSTIWRHEILKRFYEASFKTGMRAELYILDDKKHLMASNREYISAEEENAMLLQWNILEKINQNPDVLQLDVSKGKEKKLFLGRAVQKNEDMVGYLVLVIRQREFQKLFDHPSAEVVITDEEGWTLFASEPSFIDNIGKLREGMRQKGGAFLKGRSYSLAAFVPEGLPLCLYTMYNYTGIFHVLGIVIITSVLILVFLLWVGKANVYKLSADFTGDIDRLSHAFSLVTSGNLEVELAIDSSRELRNIGQGFNAMLAGLKRQMTQNRELAEMVAYEQIKQLKGQFKSHFLFNTLDNIRYICPMSPKMAQEMILLLSKLLRYHAETKSEKVALQEDLEYLKMYFEIVKIRFGDAFVYSIEVEEQLKEAPVLKLLLQPLAENAVKYGFASRENINVRILVQRAGEEILLICKDTGAGIDEENLQKIQKNLRNRENKTAHLGLYNVNRRVALTYGENYGVTLHNDGGLVATINIPLEKQAQNG